MTNDTVKAQPRGGLILVLNSIHREDCRLGKNARIVSTAIAWHMGRKHEAYPGIPTLISETGLGKSAVSLALGEACGPLGPFTKRQRGPRKTNLYEIKDSLISGNPATTEELDLLESESQTSQDPEPLMSGRPDIKEIHDVRKSDPLMSGNPYAEQITEQSTEACENKDAGGQSSLPADRAAKGPRSAKSRRRRYKKGPNQLPELMGLIRGSLGIPDPPERLVQAGVSAALAAGLGDEAWLETALTLWRTTTSTRPAWLASRLLALVSQDRPGAAILEALGTYLNKTPGPVWSSADFVQEIDRWVGEAPLGLTAGMEAAMDCASGGAHGCLGACA